MKSSLSFFPHIHIIIFVRIDLKIKKNPKKVEEDEEQ